MKIRKGMFSGMIGDEVYVNTRTGQVVRSRPSGTWRSTNARARVQNDLVRISRLWRAVTDEKFRAWAAAGKKAKMKPYWLFSKINRALADVREAPVMDPPKFETIRPNPVGELEIRNRGGVITMRLRVPRAPAKYTFVRS